MRWMGVGMAVMVLVGCTSTRLEQRGECWVKQTKKWPNRVSEDLGPCGRAQPEWGEDRFTRVVQECVAHADYRWHNRALTAWTRGQPLPEEASDAQVLEACMAEAAQVMLVENEGLKWQLGDVQADREHYRQRNGQLAEALGEAAKKPAPAAIATATARGDGRSTSENETLANTETAQRTSSAERRIRTAAPKQTVPAPVPTAVEPAEEDPAQPKLQKVTSPKPPTEAVTEAQDRACPLPPDCPPR
jgi:hypothetical protein